MSKTIKFNIKLNVDGKEQLASATANVKDLKAAVENGQSAAKKAVKEFSQFGVAVYALGDSVNKLQGMMQGLAASYQASVQANTQLTTVMKQRMNATDEDIAAVKKTIAAQKQLGVIGGVVQMRGAQQIATFLSEKQTLNTLIPAMNNLLAQQKGLNATQEDAYGVANLMGKAMQGQTSALKRVGITFTDAEAKVMQFGTEQQRAAMLAQIITNNVGEMNAELGKTEMGKQKQLENQFAAIKVKIGEIAQQGLPFVAFASQSLNLATSLMTLGKGVRALWMTFASMNVVVKASAVVSATARTAFVGLAATGRVLQAVFTGATVGATTLKMAIKGLLITTGVGIAVAALSAGTEYLMNRSSSAAGGVKELTAAEQAAEQEHQQMQQQIADVTSQMNINISTLKNFRGSKAEEKKLVEQMNTTYGSAMGYYSTVSQWYTALTGNSKKYCDQMINEIRIRNLANKSAELKQKQHDILYDDKGKSKVYSKKNERQLVKANKGDLGAYLVGGVYYKSVEKAGTSQLAKAQATYNDLKKQDKAVTKEMEALVKQNANVGYNKYAGYTQTAPTATTATPHTTTTTTGSNEVIPKGSLKDLETQLQEAQNKASTAVGRQAYQAAMATVKQIEAAIENYKWEGAEPNTIKNVSEIGSLDKTGGLVSERPNLNLPTGEDLKPLQTQLDSINSDNIDKLKERLEEVNEEWYTFDGVFDKIQQGWGTIQGVGDGITSITDALEGNQDAWQTVCSLINGFIEIVSGIQAVVKLIDGMTVASELHAASEVKNAAAVEASNIAETSSITANALAAAATVPVIAANEAATASFLEAAAASYFAAHAYIPFAGAGIASGFAAQAVAETKAIGVLSAFAYGGIVGGTSTTGDKIPVRVNSGEMILNRKQQAQLFAIANGEQRYQNISLPQRQQRNINISPSIMAQLSASSQTGQKVELSVKGRRLVGVLANETRISSRSGRRTNIQI